MSFFEKTLVSDGLSMLISYAVILSRIPAVNVLKMIAPKTGQIPQIIFNE